MMMYINRKHESNHSTQAHKPARVSHWLNIRMGLVFVRSELQGSMLINPDEAALVTYLINVIWR
jgi:hypothetical protein